METMNFLGRLGVPTVLQEIDWEQSDPLTQGDAASAPDAKIQLLPTDSITSGTGPSLAVQERLVRSIETHGVLVPLLLRAGKDGAMTVVDGNKRLAAAQALKLQAVPAVVRELDDATALLLGVWQLINSGEMRPSEAAIARRALVAAGLPESQAEPLHVQQQRIRRRTLLSARVFNQSLGDAVDSDDGEADNAG
jgi:ParB-like nuclease domain